MQTTPMGGVIRILKVSPALRFLCWEMVYNAVRMPCWGGVLQRIVNALLSCIATDGICLGGRLPCVQLPVAPLGWAGGCFCCGKPGK